MSKTYRFSMEGPLHGYRAGLNRVFDPAYKRFKEAIRLIANTEGIPEAITPESQAEVSVVIWWKKKARIDGSNVLKAIEDGLWDQDRAIAHGEWHRWQNTGDTERVEVAVTVYDGTEGD